MRNLVNEQGDRIRATVLLATFVAIAGTAWTWSGITAKATPSGSAYVAVSPCRVLDTRGASGPTAGAPIAGGTTLDVTVTGTFCGTTVPSGATAVVLNATVTSPTKNGFLSLYPTGSPSSTSNLNFATGQTVANLTTVQVGSGGKVTMSNGQAAGGTAHVILDLEGYYADPGTSTAGQYVPLTPARITDTRGGSGCPNAGQTIAAGHSLNVQVTGATTCSGGAGGVPSTGVSAVVFNLTGTHGTSGTFLTAYPAGASSVPTASNLNIGPGETRPNRVIIPVGSGGQISVFNANGNQDVVIDVDGYYTDGTASAGAGTLFTPITPTRFEDTRTDGHTIPANGTLTFQVAGFFGVPSGATAVVENVTDDHATQGSYFTVFPGPTQPLASDLNFGPGQDNPNLAQATLASDGTERIFNCCGSADAIVDVFGYFAAQSAPSTNQTYTVSAPSPSATPTVSTSGSATQGQVTYTVSGFTSSNTPTGHVDIALLPETGANAPVNTGGTWTFTSSAGSGMAGNAAGEATSDKQTSTSVSSPNQSPTNVPACVPATSGCFGYISSINGSPTSNAPDLAIDVTAASGGTLTFTVNSFQVDGAIPVVFSEPMSSDTGTLMVGTNAQPAAGYPFGVGGAVNWEAAPATTGTYTDWVVSAVDNAGNAFVACDQGNTQCLTFSDSTGGDSYTYLDPSQALTLAQFQAMLSGPTAQKNGLPASIPGDELTITYSTSGSSMFAFSNSTAASSPGSGSPGGQADVPAAPSGLAATASTTPSGVQLSWMAAPNLDVAMDSSATYKLYRAPVTGSTVGTYAPLVSPAACASPSSTCVVDTTATAGQSYSYVVSAVSGTMNSNVATEGPASAAAMFTAAATPPISISTAETPCSACTTLVATDQLKVVFNETVTLASTWNLVLTDNTNVNTLDNTNSIAALSTTTVTNDTVTYQVGPSGPTKTSGTNASLTNLEALTQMGVAAPGGSGGRWNLPGSGRATADGGSTAQSGQVRVFTLPPGPATNTPIGQAPAAGATAPSTVTVSSCMGTDAIRVYKADGTYIGPSTPPSCASGTATVTTAQTMTAGQTILVTQQASNAYESLASPVVVANPMTVTGPATAPTAGMAANYTLSAPGLANGTYTICVGGPGTVSCSGAGTPAAPSPNGTAGTYPTSVSFSGGNATEPVTLVDATSGALFFTLSGGTLTAPYQGSLSVTVGPAAVDTAYIPAGSSMCLTSSFTASALTQPATPTGNATQTDMGTPPPAACFQNPPTGLTIQALDQFGNMATGSGTVMVVSSDSAATNVGVCSSVSASCTTASASITIAGGTGTLYLWINSTSAFAGVTLTFSQMTPPTPNTMYTQVTTVSD